MDSNSNLTSAPSENKCNVVAPPRHESEGNGSVDLPPPLVSSRIHLPLRDPISQIRLLHLKAGPFSEPINCTLTVWQMDSLPAFSAISYTWGNPNKLHSIYVNGEPFVVRESCQYALSQVRQHHPESYVWVDSICIDQANLKEKGHQVGIMSDIYAKSSAVLACVGPHDHYSVFLKDALRHVEAVRDIPIRRTPWNGNDKSRWEAWAAARSFQHLRRLCMSYEGFVRRPYWSRLWILQELVAGADRIQLLCGSNVLDWYRFRELGALLQYHWEERKRPFVDHNLDAIPILELWEFAMAYQRVLPEFLLYRTKSLECENILDRIYGIMRLVDWPSNVARLTPVYTRTPAELAIEVIQRSPPYLWVLGDLLVNLRLDADTFVANLPTVSPLGASRSWHMSVLAAHKLETYQDMLVIFREDSHRKPAGCMVAARAAQTVNYLLKPTASPTGLEDSLSLTIYDGESLTASGLACADARPGDILVQTTSCDIILREQPSGELQVVGLAAMKSNLFSAEGRSLVCVCFPASRVAIWDDVHLELQLEMIEAVRLAVIGTPELEASISHKDTPKKGSYLRALSRGDGRRLSLTHLVEHL